MLKVEGLEFSFVRGTPLWQEIEFSLAPGEVATLVGPSGTGKTTLLRCLAGLESPQAGHVHVSPGAGIGFVFQDPSLFPFLSVQQNIELSMPNRLSKSERAIRLQELLSLLHIETLAQRLPSEISGGQQQRVALARALAYSPEILLMDEPFSNLDASLRQELSRDLMRIFHRLKITALIVTHELSEAFAISDKIGVMIDGRLRRFDTVLAVIEKPQSMDVANYLNLGHWLQVRMEIDLADEKKIFRTPIGDLQIPQEFPSPKGSGQLLVRPENISFCQRDVLKYESKKCSTEPYLEYKFTATLKSQVYTGGGWRLSLQTGDFHWPPVFSPNRVATPAELWTVVWSPRQLEYFPRTSHA